MSLIDLGLSVTAINKASGPLREVGASLDGLSDKVKKTGENAQATANRLKAIEVVIGGIILEKSYELGKSFVDLAAATQNSDLRLAAWAGGTKQAQAILQDFNDKVGSSGIGLGVMADGFVKLRTAGVGVGQAQRTVEDLANAIASVGGENLSSKMDAVTTAIQRLSAKGGPSVRELNTLLTQTGLSEEELGKATGFKTLTGFVDALKDKTISAQQAIDGFDKAAEAKFGNFAQLLNSTVSGALSKFKNDLGLAFSELTEQKGGFDNQFTAFIQTLDEAVVKLIQDFGPDVIKRAFQIFADYGPILGDVALLILKIGTAMIGVAEIGAKIANSLPQDAVEFGILGYFIGGKKFALIAGIIGSIYGELDKHNLTLGKIAGINDQDRKDHPILSGIIDLPGQLSFMAKNGDSKAPQFQDSALGKFYADWQAKITQVEADNAKLAKFKFTPPPLSGAPENTGIENKLAELRASTANTIQGVSSGDELLDAKTSGDELRVTLDSITKQTEGWVGHLEQVRVKWETSKAAPAEIAAVLKIIDTLEGKIAVDTQAATVQAEKLYEIKKEQLALETQIALLQDKEASRQITNKINQQASNVNALLSGTPGGQALEQFDQQKAQVLEQLATYRAQANKLFQDEVANPQNQEQDDKSVQSLTNLINLTQQWADTMTAAGQVNTEMLQELGNTIDNDLASGISGLIQGTQTWGDVGRKIFGDLIDMAVKYLLKLVEMKLLTAALGAFGDGGVPGLGDGMAGLDGFAKGGAFNGSITPFANGGLTTGPTLFGLMGEAGTEAIMPLTRIGGKLGVHTTGGGGGDHYHINVTAQDTQTGMEFVSKHIDYIHGALMQKKRLNQVRAN